MNRYRLNKTILIGFLTTLTVVLLIIAPSLVREYSLFAFTFDFLLLFFGLLLLFGITKILKFEKRNWKNHLVAILIWFDIYLLVGRFLWQDALNYGSKVGLGGEYLFPIAFLLVFPIIHYVYREKFWKTILTGTVTSFVTSLLSIISIYFLVPTN